MKHVIIASTNPVKIEAVRQGMEKMFPEESYTYEGISVPSGVADQPMSDQETFIGAMNRAEGAKAVQPEADFFVGLEGGIEAVGEEMQAFAWIVILDREGHIGKARTGSFFLPPEVVRLVNAGKELGEADDIVFKRENSKQTNGAVGILTGDVLGRTEYYAEAVVLAVIPWKNPQHYFLG